MGHRIFGLPLNEVIHSSDSSGVPLFMRQWLTHLLQAVHTEDLFTIPTTSKDLHNLRIRIEKGKKIDLSLRNPRLIGGLLKLFLNELPEPLLTTDLHDHFTSLFLPSSDATSLPSSPHISPSPSPSSSSGLSERAANQRASAEYPNLRSDLSRLSQTLSQLPNSNRSILTNLVALLRMYCVVQPKTLIDMKGLCQIFGPLILRPKPGEENFSEDLIQTLIVSFLHAFPNPDLIDCLLFHPSAVQILGQHSANRPLPPSISDLDPDPDHDANNLYHDSDLSDDFLSSDDCKEPASHELSLSMAALKDLVDNSHPSLSPLASPSTNNGTNADKSGLSSTQKEEDDEGKKSARKAQLATVSGTRKRAGTAEENRPEALAEDHAANSGPTRSKTPNRSRLLMRSAPRGLVRFAASSAEQVCPPSSRSPPTNEALSPPTSPKNAAEIPTSSPAPAHSADVIVTEVSRGGRVYVSQQPIDHQLLAVKKLHSSISSEMQLLQSLLGTADMNSASAEEPLMILHRTLVQARKFLDGSQAVLSLPLAAQQSYSTPLQSYPDQTNTVVQGPSRLLPKSGAAALRGKRKTMEDVHCLLNDVNGTLPHLGPFCSFYGVFDGHNGTEAAVLAKELLPRLVLSDPSFLEGDVLAALRNGFLNADRVILQASASEVWNSGCTVAILLLITPSSLSTPPILYAANAGDAEIVVGLRRFDNGEITARPMSVRHHAKEPGEKARVVGLGGVVLGGRLFGDLAVSRALGDASFKRPSCAHDFVSAEPHISWVPLNNDPVYAPDTDYPGTPAFAVIACDGLWDVMTHQDAVNLTCQSLKNSGVGPINQVALTAAASALADEALKRGSTDNVSVVVVSFDNSAVNPYNLSSPSPSGTPNQSSGHSSTPRRRFGARASNAWGVFSGSSDKPGGSPNNNHNHNSSSSNLNNNSNNNVSGGNPGNPAKSKNLRHSLVASSQLLNSFLARTIRSRRPGGEIISPNNPQYHSSHLGNPGSPIPVGLAQSHQSVQSRSVDDGELSFSPPTPHQTTTEAEVGESSTASQVNVVNSTTTSRDPSGPLTSSETPASPPPNEKQNNEPQE